MKSKGRNIIKGAAAIAAAGGTVAGLSELLIQEAMNREEPELCRRVRRHIVYRKKTKQPNPQPMARPELPDMERVEISARDGAALVGHWYPCDHPKRVILAMHGWRSSWKRDFGPLVSFWHENGCSVLFAEQRGHGESGGDSIGFGVLERYDCINWLEWLLSRDQSQTPIYLMGISMGATTVLMAAGLTLPERVHGIMADCGFTSPVDIFTHVAKSDLHLPYGLLAPQVNGAFSRRIGCRADENSTLDALKNCKTPVLFIHGTDDTFVPIRMTWDNYKACAAPKHLLVVPGARHGQSSQVARRSYEQAMLDFWEDFDESRCENG